MSFRDSQQSVEIARVSQGDLHRWTDGAKYVLDTYGVIDPTRIPSSVKYVRCDLDTVEQVIDNHPYKYTTFYVSAPIEAVAYLHDNFTSNVVCLLP